MANPTINPLRIWHAARAAMLERSQSRRTARQDNPASGLAIVILGAAFAAIALLVAITIKTALDQVEYHQMATEDTPPPPAPRFGAATVMNASWYGPIYHGRLTAAGAHKSEAVPRKHWRFDKDALTAAHMTEPFGSILRVERAGRYVDVMITDRGPLAWTGRQLDLSEAAAVALGMREIGVSRVLVRRAER